MSQILSALSSAADSLKLLTSSPLASVSKIALGLSSLTFKPHFDISLQVSICFREPVPRVWADARSLRVWAVPLLGPHVLEEVGSGASVPSP